MADDRNTRRDFLKHSAAAASSLLIPQLAQASAPLGDVKPALYTITYLGYWYRGAALTMPQILERARKFGYEGVEIEGKRPHGFPLDWPKSRCTEFRKQAADAGVAITGIGADNDFTSPISEHREAQLAAACAMVRMAADLGTPVVRVFLAWAGATKLPEGGGRYDIAQKIWQYTHDTASDQQAWDWSRECLVDLAKFAGEHGVKLALQNHKPMITNYHEILKMIGEVDSPHLKACVDAPLMEDRSPAYLLSAARDVGSVQVQSHFGGDFERTADGRIRIRQIQGKWCGPYEDKGYMEEDIYAPFLQGLLEKGYRGYIGYELCHPLPVRNGRTVGIEYVDESTRLAAEYIRASIAEARKRAAAALA